MKTQTEAQLKGRWGELVAAFAFPAHWIVRPLPHDFGIDLQVEVFKELPPDSKERQRYRATGGHFSCQVKTQESVRTKSDTVVFSASTTDLLLAETMGASAPLVLLLVDRETRDLYYLCLTDYIPYVLDGAGSAWRSQGSVTLEIPTKNRLDADAPARMEAHWQYFKGLAFRAKLYSVSIAFQHTGVELDYALDGFRVSAASGSGHARIASDFDRCMTAFDQAISACSAAIAQELSASDSPYSGLFQPVERWLAHARPHLDRARNTFKDIDPTLLSAENAERRYAEMSRELFFAHAGYSSLTAIPRTYEELHRRARLTKAPLEFE